MSELESLGVTIDIEKSEISSSLNSVILQAFMMGMYTVIYFGTIYIYLTRSSTKQRIISAVITILFLCNVVFLGVQWYLIKWQFVDQGNSRDSVFLASIKVPDWGYIALDMSTFTVFVLGDGLLIWRCFFAWNRSLRIILLPLFLIFTEITMFLVLTVLHAVQGVTTTNAAIAARINDLTSAAYFVSFGTSLVTTVLIAYRIYYASTQSTSRRRFKNIFNIVVESGAVYSLSLLVMGLVCVSPGASNPLKTQTIAFNYYVQTVVPIVTGTAVTILVARVSMLPTDVTFPSTSIHLSGLEFGAHPTHQTDTLAAMENRHLHGVDGNLVSDELQVADNAQ